MEENKASKLNPNILAYIGDAIYEIHIRETIVKRDIVDVSKAHKIAIKYVSCYGQAFAMRNMLRENFLSEEEILIFKRARNHRTMSKPKNADPRDYKVATGFEAMLGYLHLTERNKRVEEISDEAVRIIDEKKK